MRELTDRQKVYDRIMRSDGLHYALRSAGHNGDHVCDPCADNDGKLTLVSEEGERCKAHEGATE